MSQDRDTNQRSVGFIALSTLVHAGLLTALIVLPQANLTKSSDTQGEPDRGGETTMLMDIEAAGAASTSEDAAASNAPKEIVTAQASDESAIPVADEVVPEKPAELPVEKPVAVPEKPVAKPVEKKAALPPKPKAKVVKAKAPVEKAVLTGDSEIAEAKEQDAEPEKNEEWIPTKVTEPEAKEEPVEEREPETLSAEISDEPNEEDYDKMAEEEAAQARPEPQAAPAPAPVVASAAPKKEVRSTPAAPSQLASPAPSSTSGATGTGVDRRQTEAAGNGTASRGEGSGAGSGQGTGTIAGMQGAPIIDSSLRRPLPGNRQPMYPQQDRLRGHQGTVVVIGRVEPNGLISDVKLERSSGSAQMDVASLQTFKTWKFAPDSQPALVRQPFVFNLKGEAQVIRSGLRTQGK